MDKNLEENRIDLYELNFSLHYETRVGQQILVTGDLEFLGNWNF